MLNTVGSDYPGVRTATVVVAIVVFVAVLGATSLAGQPTDCIGQSPLDNTPGSGPNTITGTSASDVFAGGGGNDTITGKGAKDYLCGNEDNDTIDGDGGGDEINGGKNIDDISGDDGSDYIHAGSEADNPVNGKADDDTVAGDQGADYLRGGTGDDDLYGGLHGSGGAEDTLIGDGGSDTAWLCPDQNASVSVDILSEGGVHVVPSGLRAEFC